MYYVHIARAQGSYPFLMGPNAGANARNDCEITFMQSRQRERQPQQHVFWSQARMQVSRAVTFIYFYYRIHV